MWAEIQRPFTVTPSDPSTWGAWIAPVCDIPHCDIKSCRDFVWQASRGSFSLSPSQPAVPTSASSLWRELTTCWLAVLFLVVCSWPWQLPSRTLHLRPLAELFSGCLRCFLTAGRKHRRALFLLWLGSQHFALLSPQLWDDSCICADPPDPAHRCSSMGSSRALSGSSLCSSMWSSTSVLLWSWPLLPAGLGWHLRDSAELPWASQRVVLGAVASIMHPRLLGAG